MICPDKIMECWESCNEVQLADAKNYYTKSEVDDKISEIETEGISEERAQEMIDTSLTDYYTKSEVDGFVDTLENADTALGGRIDTLSQDLTTEALRASTAESGLDTKIDNVNNTIQTQIQSIETELSGDYATKDYVGNYTYDKTTIDSKISEGGTFDPTQYYNKTATDTLLADKADKSVETRVQTLYTELGERAMVSGIQVDTQSGYVDLQFPYKSGWGEDEDTSIKYVELSSATASKAGVMSAQDKEKLDDVYDKATTDTLLNAKADKSTTYTKTEVDTALASKANSSDLTNHTSNTTIHVTSAEKTTWNNKSDFSGDYEDLTNKPTIPTVPTNVSAFNNDAGYLTSHQSLDGYATENWVSGYTYDKDTIDSKISEGGTFDPTQYYNKTATDTLLADKADKSTTYTKSEVDNALASKANSSDLTNHTSNTDIHVTVAEKSTWNNKSDFSGSYNDLTDKPTIPTYTAGDGITITNNVISAKVWSGTKAQYEALTNKDADCIYLIYEA